MGYLTDTPEMGSGIVYTNPLDNPANTPTAREPTGTPTAPTVTNTPGGGGGTKDKGKPGPTLGGQSSVVINRDSPSGYTYVAGISGRTGQMIRGWLPNDDPRFGWDYSPTYGLVDALGYDDMIDPSKRYKPPAASENPFAGISFEMPNFQMPTFQMPEFPQYQLPAYPTMPTAPTDPAPIQQPEPRNKRRKLTLLTGAKGTDDDSGKLGRAGTAAGQGAGKRRLLG